MEATRRLPLDDGCNHHDEVAVTDACAPRATRTFRRTHRDIRGSLVLPRQEPREAPGDRAARLDRATAAVDAAPTAPALLEAIVDRASAALGAVSAALWLL